MSKRNKKKNFIKEENMMDENITPIEENIEGNVQEPEETINEPEETINEPEETINEVVEEVNITKENIENNEVLGKVTGFNKIYVRSEPNVDSDPVGIVSITDDISIYLDKSTNDFYKVITSNGLEGYCVKECIKID